MLLQEKHTHKHNKISQRSLYKNLEILVVKKILTKKKKKKKTIFESREK